MVVRGLAIAVGLTVLGLVQPAGGAEVSAEISTRNAYVNEPIVLQIRITNATNHDPPEVPDIPGAQVRPSGPPSQQSFRVNARSWVTLLYSFQIIPTRAGVLRIPSISVRADGQTHVTKPMTVRVEASETGDLLQVKLTGDREQIFFGEAVDVRLEIWVKIYRDRNLRSGMNKEDMHRLIDQSLSAWGRYKEVLRRVNNRELTWKYRSEGWVDERGVEQSYHVYILPLTFVPTRLGPVDVGRISVVMSYPTRTKIDRDFFGRRQVKIGRSRPVRAELEPTDMWVKAPPPEDQPAEFNGAVGQYRFEVRATNTQVRVREPVELTLTISGTGALERVPPPPLSLMGDLTRDFKVPTEQIGGVVTGQRKVFEVTIRPKHAQVTQIPPIDFVYFDPVQEEYVRLQSAPIPLDVMASEQVSVAQFDDTDYGSLRGVSRLTQAGLGIRANYTEPDELLAQQGFAPGWGSAALAGGCPTFYLATLLVQGYRRRLRLDVAFARRRGAHGRALQAVQQARQQVDPGVAASSLANAIRAYISDRCNAPAGLTSGETVALLETHGVTVEGIGRVEQLLQRCEGLQYAGQVQGADGDLADETQRCLGALHKERLR